MYWLFTIFVALHGLVHLLYLAWSQGQLIPEEGFEWNTDSWLFTGWLGDQATRNLGMLLFAATTLIFLIAASGLAFRQGWSLNWLGAAAIASTLVILLMWDGRFVALADKGFIGVLINIGLLVALYGLGFPRI